MIKLFKRKEKIDVKRLFAISVVNKIKSKSCIDLNLIFEKKEEKKNV